jgi:hypothetical protein
MKIKIAQMGMHFLYLPIYYAKYRDFFGYIGSEYTIEIITARPSTDAQAFRMLMRGGAPEHPEIHFAILDPTQMLNEEIIVPAGEAPALLGGMVTNAAFWAIDRGSRKLVRVSDLAQFSKIIAFQPGTTSYSIAHRIYTDAGKTPTIESVDPGQEWTALGLHTDTIALSPDILGADIEVETGRYQIDLIVGTTPEYSNVLVSGLLSKRSVVEHHRGLVIGLLSAINHAAALVRNADPSVVEFAFGYFRGVRSQDRVRSALARSNAAYVFPYTIEVIDAQWLNAARAYSHASLPVGPDRAAAEEMHDKRAREVIESCIAPYRSLAREAVAVFSRLLDKQTESAERRTAPSWRRAWEWVRWPINIAGLVLLASLSHYLTNSEIMIIGVCAFLAYMISELKPLRLKPVPLANYIHWIIWAGFATYTVIGVHHLSELINWDLDKWMHYTGVLVALVAADLGTILAAHLFNRETRHG